jgi:hypothetical protein
MGYLGLGYAKRTFAVKVVPSLSSLPALDERLVAILIQQGSSEKTMIDVLTYNHGCELCKRICWKSQAVDSKSHNFFILPIKKCGSGHCGFPRGGFPLKRRKARLLIGAFLITHATTAFAEVFFGRHTIGVLLALSIVNSLFALGIPVMSA